MGSALNRQAANQEDQVDLDAGGGQREGVEAVRGGVKRPLETTADDEDLEISTLMHTPKKKKLKTTSRYKL